MSRIGKDERRFCVRDAFSLFAFAITLLLFVMFIFMLKSIGIRTATSPQHATSIISALLVPSASDRFEPQIRVRSQFAPG